MQESPEAQRLAQTEDKEAARRHVLDVLKQAKYQISEQLKQLRRSQEKSGVEL